MFRCYPLGFAKALLSIYESWSATTYGVRDLRFKPQLDGDLNPVEQFNRLPMGDTWDDACLLEPLMYLFNSKLLRSGVGKSWKLSIWGNLYFNLSFVPWRMPTEWASTMTKFVKEYEREAWTMVGVFHHFADMLTNFCGSLTVNIWKTAGMLLAGAGWRKASCTAHGNAEECYIARITLTCCVPNQPQVCSNTTFGKFSLGSHHLNKKTPLWGMIT